MGKGIIKSPASWVILAILFPIVSFNILIFKKCYERSHAYNRDYATCRLRKRLINLCIACKDLVDIDWWNSRCKYVSWLIWILCFCNQFSNQTQIFSAFMVLLFGKFCGMFIVEKQKWNTYFKRSPHNVWLSKLQTVWSLLKTFCGLTSLWQPLVLQYQIGSINRRFNTPLVEHDNCWVLFNLVGHNFWKKRKKSKISFLPHSQFLKGATVLPAASGSIVPWLEWFVQICAG